MYLQYALSFENLLIATSLKTDDNFNNNFFNSLNIEVSKVMFMNQTHSSNVRKVSYLDYFLHKNKKGFSDTDALITNIKNIPLVVKTADCLPIVIYCKKSNAISVIHAGWRGIVSDIIMKTINAMVRFYKSSPKDMYVYMGPRIFLDDYEVGSEVANLFESKIFKHSSFYVDIAKEALLKLTSMGVNAHNIEDSKLNTYRDDRFYSYRRDGKNKGRVYTIAMLK